jgi:hypothetical protein
MFAEIDANQLTTTARQSAAEAAMAFTIGLDAIDVGELVYCPADDRRSAGLKRLKVEAPCLPLDRSAFQKWRKAVHPLFSRLVGYARRLNLVSTREQEVARRSDDLGVEADAIQRVLRRQTTEEVASGFKDGPATLDATILARGRSTRSTGEVSR